MQNTEAPRERVISVSLNETEWQAFVRLHPQPVVWLRQQIQESLRVRAGQAIGNRGAVISAPAATVAANTRSATTR